MSMFIRSQLVFRGKLDGKCGGCFPVPLCHEASLSSTVY